MNKIDGSQINGPEGLAQTLKYIEGKNENIARYSDKLRAEMGKVFRLFGRDDECRICGQRNNPYNVAGKDHSIETNGHLFIPKIVMSFITTDPKSFFNEDNDEGYNESWNLALCDSGLKLIKYDNDMDAAAEQGHQRNIEDAPRRVVSALAKSGRIPIFVQILSKYAEEEEQEYKEVAEIAEKMAKAIL